MSNGRIMKTIVFALVLFLVLSQAWAQEDAEIAAASNALHICLISENITNESDYFDVASATSICSKYALDVYGNTHVFEFYALPQSDFEKDVRVCMKNLKETGYAQDAKPEFLDCVLASWIQNSEEFSTAEPRTRAPAQTPQQEALGVSAMTDSAINDGETNSEKSSSSTNFDPTLFLIVLVPILLLAFAFLLYSLTFKGAGVGDPTIYRALSSDTRLGILNVLTEGDRTPTDISYKLQKSKSTICEHLEKLQEAELVEKIEREGKKWVFYKLTSKGKIILRNQSQTG